MGDHMRCTHGVKYSEECDDCNAQRKGERTGQYTLAVRDGGTCQHGVELYRRCEDCQTPDPTFQWGDDLPDVEEAVHPDLADVFPYMLTRADGVYGIMSQDEMRKQLIKYEQAGASLLIEPDRNGQTVINVVNHGKVVAVLTKRRAS